MPEIAQPLRWVDVAALLRGQPPGSIVRLPPARVEHPRDAGMALAIGVPVGQRADYRLDVGGGHDLVVSEFADGFEARLEVRPALADFEKALRDAPGSSVAGMIAAGALVGLALGRSKESALAGATIGGLAALASVRTRSMKFTLGSVDMEPALFFLDGAGAAVADVHETDGGANLRIYNGSTMRLDADQVQALGWFCVSQFLTDEPQALLDKLKRGLRAAGISVRSELYVIVEELEQSLRKP